MPKSRYARLLVVLVGLTVVMAALFLVVIRYSDTKRNQEINQKVYRNLAMRLIDEQILDTPADPCAVRKVLGSTRIFNPRVGVYMLDAAGQFIAASGQNGLKRTSVDMTPL